MKYFIKSFKQIIVLLACTFALSCSSPLRGYFAEGNAIVKINASNKGGKSILPIFTVPAKYRFTITGGPTLVEPIENDTGILQVTLAYGMYNFFVEGFDSSNIKTCESSVISKDIQTSGIEENLTLAPLSVVGLGKVSVSLSWPNALAVSKVEASCVKIGETESFTEITISQNRATYTEIKSAGNYQLVFRVWKDSELLTTRVEVVQVVVALTSSASILLESKDLDFSSIVASEYCTVAIKSDGSLWAWGNGEYGVLGNGSWVAFTSVPARIGLSSSWVQVSIRGNHILALQADGTLWGWGDNRKKQINSLAPSQYLRPVQIGTDSDWSQVSAGGEFSCAIKRDGSLWTWGAGSYGQMGDGSFIDRTIPTRIGNSTDWASINAGYAFTIALKKDGTLWSWGMNTSGQLGCNSQVNQNVPIQVGTDSSWNKISASSTYALAIKSDGTLWGWGDNSSQRICSGSNTPQLSPKQIGTNNQWRQVVAGGDHSFALDSAGVLYGWGANIYGEVGIYSINTDASLSKISIPTVVSLPAACKQIAAGYSHSVCFIEDGRVLTWGRNHSGELGIGKVTIPFTPVIISTTNDWFTIATSCDHSLVIKNDGSLWSWGLNTTGQLGIGQSVAYHLIPVRVGNDLDWTQVKAGFKYTLALKKDGSLWNWGAYTSFVPCRNGLESNWKKISAGYEHYFAIKNDNSLWSWGKNDNGELGLGTSDPVTYRTPIQVGTDLTWETVVAGDSFSIGLKKDGSLWGWGKNSEGQLGISSFENKNFPVQIGTDTDWDEVSAGDYHVLARKKNGTIWIWGKEVVKENNFLVNKNLPVQVGTSSDWLHVFAGRNNDFAIKVDGSLWAWGNNSNGQFGNGERVDQSIPIRVGSELQWSSIATNAQTIALKSDGSLWGWSGINCWGGWAGGVYIPTPNGFSIY